MPVGVPDPEVGETMAVKVTGWPNTLGLADDVTVVVVAVCAGAAPNDSSRIALASATGPIARRLFCGACDARNTRALSARANAAHQICRIVSTEGAPQTGPFPRAAVFVV